MSVSAITTVDKSSILGSIRKKEITILLVGETGSGKTSLMTLLVNLFNGRGPFELVDEDNFAKEFGLERTRTQCPIEVLYVFTTSDGTKVQIIDTPSLTGLDQSAAHDAFKTTPRSIDAILILANGQIKELGIEITHTLSVVTNMLPESHWHNLGFVYTHSDALSFSFPIDSLPRELKSRQYWTIENPLISYQIYKRQVEAKAPERVLATLRGNLEIRYKETVNILKECLKWVDKCPEQNTIEGSYVFARWEDIFGMAYRGAGLNEPQSEAASSRVEGVAYEGDGETQHKIVALIMRYDKDTISKNILGHLKSIVQLLEFRKELKSRLPKDIDLDVAEKELYRWKRILEYVQHAIQQAMARTIPSFPEF